MQFNAILKDLLKFFVVYNMLFYSYLLFYAIA